jgi:uncharacterized tellurite resistance protein B-like protein
MLAKLKQYFENNLAADEQDTEAALKRAACALMLEVSKADFNQNEDEIRRVDTLLEKRYQVPAIELAKMRDLAEQENAANNSLHPFTLLVKEHYDNQQKFQLVESLWQVAYDDGVIDKHEEALIRTIADLIYLPHSQFIKAKLAAEKTVAG